MPCIVVLTCTKLQLYNCIIRMYLLASNFLQYRKKRNTNIHSLCLYVSSCNLVIYLFPLQNCIKNYQCCSSLCNFVISIVFINTREWVYATAAAMTPSLWKWKQPNYSPPFYPLWTSLFHLHLHTWHSFFHLVRTTLYYMNVHIIIDGWKYRLIVSAFALFLELRIESYRINNLLVYDRLLFAGFPLHFWQCECTNKSYLNTIKMSIFYVLIASSFFGNSIFQLFPKSQSETIGAFSKSHL